jgi:RecB family endonuclease NucS
MLCCDVVLKVVFNALKRARVVFSPGEIDYRVRDNVLLVYGLCVVSYFGRAKSEAQSALRLVIIKPDGSILVHENAGVAPLNWNSPPAELEIRGNEIVSTRKLGKESVIIRFSKIFFTAEMPLSTAQFDLDGSHENIVQAIVDNPSIVGKKLTFVAREYKTEYGNIDILFKNETGEFVVVEVKRARADFRAVMQLHSYVLAIRKQEGNASGFLVAPSIARRARNMSDALLLRFIQYPS